MLEKIISLLREKFPQMSIEPFFQEGYSKGMVYSCSPLSDDGIVRRDKLEIHLIDNNLKTLCETDNAIRKELLTIADETLTNEILQISINGGGTMEDLITNTYHLITYYNIVSKGGKING